MAKFRGQAGAGLINAFALAYQAAQLTLKIAGAGLGRRIGKRIADRRGQNGRRQKHQQKDKFLHSAGCTAADGTRAPTRRRPHRLSIPPNAITNPPSQMKGASGLT